jgi:ATP-dependent DNA helicase RecG
MLTLSDPVSKIYGVGPKMAKLMARIGIHDLSDLLFYFPFRYDDFSKITPIAQSYSGERFAIRGIIKQIDTTRSFRKHIFITSAIIEDKTGALRCIWFNQPYLARALRGSEVILVGKIEIDHNGRYLSAPQFEKVKREQIHTARIVPVYPETRGLSSKFLRSKIKIIINLASKVSDFLPQNIKAENNLIELSEAIKHVHFPDNQQKLAEAQKRLAFDELFLLQLKMQIAKGEWQALKAPAMKFDEKLIKNFVNSLPFKLTNAQRRSAWEIICDITNLNQRSKIKDKKLKTSEIKLSEQIPPMNRLLEGDVGSGKTIVAAMAILVCAQNNYQSIMMAPTEILAFQHYRNLYQLLKSAKIHLALLTNSKSVMNQRKIKRTDLIKKIQEGYAQVVVGTHALISDKMSFKKLGLAIVDEQHRFGVNQRAALRKKSRLTPHILSMTATPIPRTLSLALYGDLDISVIDEMPKGRQKIGTKLIHPRNRLEAYQFIRGQIKAGRQVFVICPLIEESDFLGVKSVKTEYQKLKKEIFPDLKIEMLHGRMKGAEKEKIMKDFSAGKFDILVSTSVVEVGVDIPNATIMMIEGSERFGLAQLHQFRGRVGRGKHQSYCFLFTEIPSPKVLARLHALVESNDGFALAEKDLKFRGPGEIYGTKQSGLVDLRMAKLSDLDLLRKAKSAAEKTYKMGLDKYSLLAEELQAFQTEKRLE